MALLSGEVETRRRCGRHPPARSPWFRMALLSGEVETTARGAYRDPGGYVPDGFAIRGS